LPDRAQLLRDQRLKNQRVAIGRDVEMSVQPPLREQHQPWARYRSHCPPTTDWRISKELLNWEQSSKSLDHRSRLQRSTRLMFDKCFLWDPMNRKSQPFRCCLQTYSGQAR